jgi:predicted short-subunit dehydrogenase-like oxidoreductase (DUF2520 family)
MTKLETRRTLQPELPQLAIVGIGRAGGSIARAARAAGIRAHAAGRGDALEACRQAEAALLCVPDASLEEVAEGVTSAIPPLRLVGHVSGAGGLDVLSAPAAAGAETFSLHPLQTLPDGESDLGGAACAVAGSTPEAAAFAEALGRSLGMRPFAVDDADRAAYHAAAAMASNFIVALAESAGELLGRVGIDEPRELLAPLVLRSAANWTQAGPAALTGPIARGDEATVERHRQAIAEVAPELLELYDALAARTRSVAAHPPSADAGADEGRPTKRAGQVVLAGAEQPGGR